MDALFQLHHLSYHYQDGGLRVDILKDCEYSFEKGKTYAIIGPSGCGKRTLLSLIGVLEATCDGYVE